jgi:CDP-diacylglycerol---serine O-phosphatidyltransferase
MYMRYLIPNSVTGASLVIGLTAIERASRGNYELSAWLIVWCALLDRVDGVAARMLHACSPFGVQFDTLADLAAFCLAPAFLAYFLLVGDPRYAVSYGTQAARAGLMFSAIVYVLCGAVRLARFNVQTEELGPQWFRGLPVTIAGAIVATFILSAWEFALPSSVIASVPLLLITCAAMMVTTLWLPKSNVDGIRIPMACQILAIVAIYGLGFTRTFPIFLLAAAFLYPVAGFVFGALHPPESGGRICLPREGQLERLS